MSRDPQPAIEFPGKNILTDSQQIAAESAQQEVLAILTDTAYWKKHSSYSFKAPHGIRAMQKTTSEKVSKISATELLDALRIDANESLEKKSSRFFSRERGIMTSRFYGLFQKYNSWEKITNSLEFKNLQGNHKAFLHDQSKKTETSLSKTIDP